MRAPCSARRLAATAPIPEVAPVMTTVLPFMSAVALGPAASCRGGRVRDVRIDHAEGDGRMGVEEAHFLPLQQLQELACLLGRDDELHFDGERPRELEETRLVQHVMAAKAG